MSDDTEAGALAEAARLNAAPAGMMTGQSVGQSDDWCTPPEIFAALRLTFDLDPCSPGPDHWVPARRVFTQEDDGLTQDWNGLVWMNPPFGGRNGHVPWLRKFFQHGNGIALVRAYTSAAWFHDYVPQADTMLFPRGKTKFIRPDGTRGEAPNHGIVLLGIGEQANASLYASGLGIVARPGVARVRITEISEDDSHG